MKRQSSYNLEKVNTIIKLKLARQYDILMNGTPPRRQQDKLESPKINISFAEPSKGIFTFGQKLLSAQSIVDVPRPSKIPRAQLHRAMYKHTFTVEAKKILLQGVRLNRRFDLLMKFRNAKEN